MPWVSPSTTFSPIEMKAQTSRPITMNSSRKKGSVLRHASTFSMRLRTAAIMRQGYSVRYDRARQRRPRRGDQCGVALVVAIEVVREPRRAVVLDPDREID